MIRIDRFLQPASAIVFEPADAEYAAGQPCKPGETAERSKCIPVSGEGTADGKGEEDAEVAPEHRGIVGHLRAGLRGVKERVKAVEHKMAASLQREGYSPKQARAIMLAATGAKLGGGPVQLTALAIGGPAAYAVVAGSVVGPLADAALVFLGAKYGRRAAGAAKRLFTRRKEQAA